MDEQIYDHIYAQEDWHWWFRGRRAVIHALLERAELAPNPRILDAGCGTGRNLVELGPLGEAHGVDASPQAVEYCRKRGLARVQHGTLDALPFEPGSFDLMLMSDVLEHIEDDDEALRELLRVATPAGRLVMTVPAYGWMWSQHDVSHHHHRRYTRPLLRERVRAAGWEPTFATYFNSILLPPIALVRALARRGEPKEHGDMELTPGRLNGVLSLPMRAEAGLIRRGVRLPAGVSIGMVCRPAEPVPSLPLAAAGAR
jgi:SAM-dependent methyltransferase